MVNWWSSVDIGSNESKRSITCWQSTRYCRKTGPYCFTFLLEESERKFKPVHNENYGLVDRSSCFYATTCWCWWTQIVCQTLHQGFSHYRIVVLFETAWHYSSFLTISYSVRSTEAPESRHFSRFCFSQFCLTKFIWEPGRVEQRPSIFSFSGEWELKPLSKVS